MLRSLRSSLLSIRVKETFYSYIFTYLLSLLIFFHHGSYEYKQKSTFEISSDVDPEMFPHIFFLLIDQGVFVEEQTFSAALRNIEIILTQSICDPYQLFDIQSFAVTSVIISKDPFNILDPDL